MSLLRKLLIAGALICVPPAGYAGSLYLTGNVHEVVPHVLYRSGQLTPAQLDRLIRLKGIRSILNLRGEHRDEAWWREETLVAASNGVEHLSLAVSSRHSPDMAAMRALVEEMRDAPKPMLVHCASGSNRTGLAAALFELAVEGEPSVVAEKQLSLAYGHFPWLGSPTHAMDEAFANYVSIVGMPGDESGRIAVKVDE